MVAKQIACFLPLNLKISRYSPAKQAKLLNLALPLRQGQAFNQQRKNRKETQ